MSKISLIVSPLQPGKRDAFVEAFTPVTGAAKDEVGTELCLLNSQDDDENVAWVYELYTDADAEVSAPEIIARTPHLAADVDL